MAKIYFLSYLENRLSTQIFQALNLGVFEVGKSNETILFCVKKFLTLGGGRGCFCPLGRPSRGTVRRLLLLIRCNMRAGSCNYSNEVPSLPPSLIIYSLNKYFLE